ncbi:MAG TPA: glycosyltransferase [Solirubrobacteraceae bacterium]
MAGDARRPVDVLVVATGSTPGNRRSDTDLITALEELGLTVAVASSDFGLVGSLRMSLNLIDLTQAVSIRLAVGRVLRRVSPRAIIYGSGSAALLEPSSRLRIAGVRFDSLGVDNRPGRRHMLQRALQRRIVDRAALMIPMSRTSPPPAIVTRNPRPPVALPTPVERFGASAGLRERIAVCYAGAPEKKGLGVIVEAWAAVPAYELHITGIDAAAGRAFLARRGIEEPPRVRWRGRLDRDEYRTLTSTAELFVAAARYEDYGIAQLEALADGALLVTAASAGPYDALALARQLAPELVASERSPGALAAAVRAAERLDEATRDAYRERAQVLVAPYTRESFTARLRDELLPELFAAAG